MSVTRGNIFHGRGGGKILFPQKPIDITEFFPVNFTVQKFRREPPSERGLVAENLVGKHERSASRAEDRRAMRRPFVRARGSGRIVRQNAIALGTRLQRQRCVRRTRVTNPLSREPHKYKFPNARFPNS